MTPDNWYFNELYEEFFEEQRTAQAIEAHRAATVKQGAVADESAVAESDAPKGESS